MKILFLDIDGVINSAKCGTMSQTDMFPLDKYAAFLVGKIVLDTDCKVVVSSSWRHSKEGLEQIRNRVTDFIGITPTLPYPSTRGAEIQAYLDEFKAKEGREVDNYAILDDDTDMLPSQLPCFFKTTWDEGLTPEIAELVTKHLNKKVCVRGAMCDQC